jgi:hypothetical protein
MKNSTRDMGAQLSAGHAGARNAPIEAFLLPRRRAAEPINRLVMYAGLASLWIRPSAGRSKCCST